MVKEKKTTKKDKADGKFAEDLDVYTCDVSSDNVFYCANGKTFKNVVELGDSLKEMDEDTFGAHVTSEKNDFATWIYDVIGDVYLADALRGIEDLEKTREEVLVRIDFIQGGN